MTSNLIFLVNVGYPADSPLPFQPDTYCTTPLYRRATNYGNLFRAFTR